MGRDPKGTPHSRKMEAAIAASRRGLLPGDGGPIFETATEACSHEVARALMPFLLRDDGWLRITSQEDGERVYWKWKWTGGPYDNHYVMVVYNASESSQALATLAAKVDAVDRGEKPPVKDHYFQRKGR